MDFLKIHLACCLAHASHLWIWLAEIISNRKFSKKGNEQELACCSAKRVLDRVGNGESHGKLGVIFFGWINRRQAVSLLISSKYRPWRQQTFFAKKSLSRMKYLNIWISFIQKIFIFNNFSVFLPNWPSMHLNISLMHIRLILNSFWQSSNMHY